MKVSIVLLQSKGDRERLSAELAETLGIKPVVAEKILQRAPLRVFELEEQVADKVLQLLNEGGNFDWIVTTGGDDELKGINWARRPTIKGQNLADIEREVMGADEEALGVAEPRKGDSFPAKKASSMLCPHCHREIDPAALVPAPVSLSPSRPLSERQPETAKAPKGKIEYVLGGDEEEMDLGRLADSWSEELEKREESPESGTSELTVDEVVTGSGIRLAPGKYSLYLPALKSTAMKDTARRLCNEVLGWEKRECATKIKQPIVCVAKDVDASEAQWTMERFEVGGLRLKSKFRSK
ncbi:MAG: hypothetical protein HQL31_02680 [Planctomycetes bacterium]|nr:hypothetical protein [Planctomycetota bacterium]